MSNYAMYCTRPVFKPPLLRWVRFTVGTCKDHRTCRLVARLGGHGLFTRSKNLWLPFLANGLEPAKAAGSCATRRSARKKCAQTPQTGHAAMLRFPWVPAVREKKGTRKIARTRKVLPNEECETGITLPGMEQTSLVCQMTNNANLYLLLR